MNKNQRLSIEETIKQYINENNELNTKLKNTDINQSLEK